MNQNYIIPNQWSIIEEGFEAERVRSSESLFSLGNGAMANVLILKRIIQEKHFKEVILQVFIILIRPELVGGKTVIPSILQKY